MHAAVSVMNCQLNFDPACLRTFSERINWLTDRRHAIDFDDELHMYVGVVQASPKGDLVLIKIADAEKASMGGVLLPEKARVKPTCGEAAESSHSTPHRI